MFISDLLIPQGVCIWSCWRHSPRLEGTVRHASKQNMKDVNLQAASDSRPALLLLSKIAFSKAKIKTQILDETLKVY